MSRDQVSICAAVPGSVKEALLRIGALLGAPCSEEREEEQEDLEEEAEQEAEEEEEEDMKMEDDETEGTMGRTATRRRSR